mmetsp:Transcript_18109/g.43300  ORF Transcript_18109/g.43300 Transcript_18109/m.43300 type:complete len:268 (+) Transcript_18109:10-813(+)
MAFCCSKRTEEPEPVPDEYPPAEGNGQILPLNSDVFYVEGYFTMMPLTKVRSTMTILRDGNELTLVNTVRLDEKGLRHLEELGQVRKVVRLGGGHGTHDAFYVQRYNAILYGLAGMKWGPDCGEPQKKIGTIPLQMDRDLAQGSPVPTGRVIILETKPDMPEAALHVDRHKLLITCDCVQNHGAEGDVPSGMAGSMFSVMGFKGEARTPPMWFKFFSPSGTAGPMQQSLDRLHDVQWSMLITAHGPPCTENPQQKHKACLGEVDFSK